ncbi:hypothetical protein A9C11_13990 [Pseudomonas citronellolis]|uniref:Uncharacterized protein n=1 Tax=Pseudomonas citronellolis TaxID=53408 RepID=A0A1A9KC09_9PSED|nr:hypothetical protein A9C11_13990 [Pseudomonas citronellolis]
MPIKAEGRSPRLHKEAQAPAFGHPGGAISRRYARPVAGQLVQVARLAGQRHQRRSQPRGFLHQHVVAIVAFQHVQQVLQRRQAARGGIVQMRRGRAGIHEQNILEGLMVQRHQFRISHGTPPGRGRRAGGTAR